ncbi:MAG: TrkH family potassium uptake protein [Pseudomonadota bacterium]|nr:TrkH family potassium uptake protein [Pseudomonadota bacterium]
MNALARSTLPVLNVLGYVVMMFAATLLVPLAFAVIGDDGAQRSFNVALFATAGCGVVLVLATQRFKRELQSRDGFLLVTLAWTVLPALATVPLLLSLPQLDFTRAYFETMSGLTTTGATVLTGLDALPLSINVWRHLLVWLGGMGILVLVVAILPLLGVGGAQAFKAETAGPLKETKLTPRIADTAKALYAVYFGISVVCFFAYRWAGMSWSDAFMHMCSTMGLGGFSSHDASFGYWNSPLIEYTAVFFMVLAGFNFTMHFLATRRRSLLVYVRDSESKAYVLTLFAASLLIAAFLLARDVYPDWWTSLRYALFNTVSIATTTGYASTDYNQWPIFAPVLMIFLSAFTTCAGSTGGGIKMIRGLILLKQARRELTRILHPRSINPVIVDGNVIENNVIFAVLAFMLIYGAAIVWLTFLLLLSGLDVITAFTAIVACINNMGPGLNQVGPAFNYGGLNEFETWVCTFAMLIGRLELFSVLVLLTPAFWRK